ncbi:MAG: Hsp20/alpha crystallin family protein [Lachnospiraceae bacterium]|nr:Hsp20/alpha crystallin family protein [Lachnospiraceae bacterium]
MLMPSVFGENLFDDLMDLDFPYDRDFEKAFFGKRNPLYGKNASKIMKTDVKDIDNGYEISVDLPGFKKDEIKVSMDQGYLNISAEKGLDKEDKKDHFIRRERYCGVCSRSFYLGDNYTNADIQAKYESGILTLKLPKKDANQVEQNRYIAIEG